MEPRSISASALKVAGACMARYEAEYIDRARGLSTSAADLGTTCHLALQTYVQTAVMDGTQPQTVDYLLSCYTNAFLEVMRSWDYDSPIFKDGANMMRVWHERNDFSTFTVISCEVKSSFEVPYSVTPDGYFESVDRKMPLNYIADRVDDLGRDRIRVVDYKTWRACIDVTEVKTLEQARIYALAYQIQYPNAKEVWVSIDQLRGDEVGYCFTRDDNAKTWRWLKKTLQGIIDTPSRRARETINDECGYCIRKSKCHELRKHTEAGGVLDMTPDQAMKLKYEVQTAIKALGYLLDDLEKKLGADLNEMDMRELSSVSFGPDEVYKVTTKPNYRSEVNSQMLPDVIGDDLALEIADFAVGKVKALKGDPRIRDWAAVEKLIEKRMGKTTVKVTKLKTGGAK